jgi:hypothetical protein
VNELSLEIRAQTPGVLNTNAQDILNKVREMLPKYKAENYSEENLAEAKADKATLEKLRTALNDERLRLEREFMVPFMGFKETINEACGEIGKAIAAIGEITKAVDKKTKDEKQAVINELWAAKKWDVLPLSRVQRSDWLNKATSRKTIASEIAVIISDTDANIALLKDLCHADDFEAVKARYLETLDYKVATTFAMKLRNIRNDAEDRKKAAEEAAAIPPPSPPAPAPVKAAPPPSSDGMYTRAFKVTGTRDQIIALGNFMKANGIAFEKIEL